MVKLEDVNVNLNFTYTYFALNVNFRIMYDIEKKDLTQ